MIVNHYLPNGVLVEKEAEHEMRYVVECRRRDRESGILGEWFAYRWSGRRCQAIDAMRRAKPWFSVLRVVDTRNGRVESARYVRQDLVRTSEYGGYIRSDALLYVD
ncbi:hypothetical protein vBSlqSZDD2_26 [Serratia phage vB_SlqS_ZDD2]|nr:hypothetical protein vBSlqSZDD2_26 [Serratia phage vB_SlqS_ZDD2]